MPVDSWRTVSGVAVLVAGVATAMMISGTEADTTEPQVASVAVTASPATVSTIETSAPGLPGVSDPVVRVLQWNGNTGFANPTTRAEIPSAVVDALVAYGVPIAVPSTEVGR